MYTLQTRKKKPMYIYKRKNEKETHNFVFVHLSSSFLLFNLVAKVNCRFKTKQTKRKKCFFIIITEKMQEK
jgi:hypothetical protein